MSTATLPRRPGNGKIALLAWVIIGVAMATGLDDALFTSLGSTYGLEARPIIVGITLISGLCTTVIWPLQALVVTSFRVSLFLWI